MKKDFSGIEGVISNTSFFDIVGTNENDAFVQDYWNGSYSSI